MINTYDFKALGIGDVFYVGNVRHLIESIEHREIEQRFPWGTQTIPEATCRTSIKKSANRAIYIGHMNFLNLRPMRIDKVVKKDKVRGTRAYKSRRDYPFVIHIDKTELEKSEANDCTVRALAVMLDCPYADAHTYLKEEGRRDRHGFVCGPAYAAKGMKYTYNMGDTKFGALVKSGTLPERCIVRTRGHVQAVVNGKVHDTARIGQNSVVFGWWYNVNA